MATLAGSGVAVAGASADGSAEVDCPAYRELLLHARADLLKGDRASAIALLRRVRAALDDCRRRAEGETALAVYDSTARR